MFVRVQVVGMSLAVSPACNVPCVRSTSVWVAASMSVMERRASSPSRNDAEASRGDQGCVGAKRGASVIIGTTKMDEH